MHGIIGVIRAAELFIAAVTAALVAVGNWDAILVAIPGLTGLVLAGHHYRRASRGRGSGRRI